LFQLLAAKCRYSHRESALSVLIKTLQEFKKWLESAAIEPANKTGFWQKFFGAKPTRPPFDKVACGQLILQHQFLVFPQGAGV
jgi:hypothetical protein